jgi:hypothetical protein
MTELVARTPLGGGEALRRAPAAGALAVAGILLALGLVDALSSTTLSAGLALGGGVALVGFLLLTLRSYDTAVGVALVLMAVVRFEPAPTDVCFAVIMAVAALTGRFHADRVPLLLRVIVGLLILINLASLIEVVSWSAASRFLFITAYLAIFAVWMAAYVNSPSRARRVVVTWLWIAVLSAVLASAALHLPIPGRSFINSTSVDKGERATALFKDPNVFGPFLIPIALILLEQHIAPKVPRLLHMRAVTTWLCLLALTLGVLFSYSRAAWANLAIGIAVVIAVSAMRRRGGRRAMRALVGLVLVGGVVVVILSASGSIHLLEERAHLQGYDTHRFAAQSFGWSLGWTHPVGIGPGQFEYHSPVASHSTFVRAFAEQGFGGLLLWIALLLSTLVLALRNVVIGRDTYGIGSAALLGAWCGLIFNSVVVDTPHWRHLWLVVALIWAGAARRAPSTLSRRSGTDAVAPTNGRRRVRAVPRTVVQPAARAAPPL